MESVVRPTCLIQVLVPRMLNRIRLPRVLNTDEEMKEASNQPLNSTARKLAAR